ncbi:unnamed protein product [Musa acuminata subsp. malaccensis]|uniref:(wild Malaysian banana) hypothetical protein n=1 Tax=Musa acuminata subsp. malaccensis TaxID=214687 RepID=A0A804KZ75_MUSAM|nr:unnamed protein product [Musa acuminata subsp. malaccensis]
MIREGSSSNMDCVWRNICLFFPSLFLKLNPRTSCISECFHPLGCSSERGFQSFREDPKFFDGSS